MLVDSHCHLDMAAKSAAEQGAMISRAEAAGIGCMVTISTHLSTFPSVRAIAEAHSSVFCSVGVHPHEADSEGLAAPDALVAAADHPKVVAIGETGLDFYYNHSDHQRQEASFRCHCAAARITGLPVIVHTRDADDDTMRILEDEQAQGAFPGLIHCFTAGPELARRALAMGFLISVSGIVTFRNADTIRQTLTDVPLDRLLVETDAPFLTPMPHRGKTNEPAFVVHTAERLAELKGVSANSLADATTANFFRLFGKARRHLAA